MEPQIIEEQKEVKGKTVISFNKPSPLWATWIFRTVFFLTTAITIWIAGTNLIPQSNKVELMLGLKCFDLFVWGMAKGIGVSRDEFEKENP